MQNKYILRLTLLGLFVNIIVNMIFYRYFMIEEMILKQVAAENIRIADLYVKHVWETNPTAIKKLHKSNYINLLQDQDFIKFAISSANWFVNLNSNVSLYDNQGNKFITNGLLKLKTMPAYPYDTIYETFITKIDEFFFHEPSTQQTFNDGFKGVTSHVLLPKILMQKDGSDKEEKAAFISSYIPIIDSKNGDFSIDGVLEINTDITYQWNNIQALEKKVFVTFIILFVILCAIVVTNTNYAQRIIDKQYEINRTTEANMLRIKNESSAHTQFLANVSHELRTPLNAIIGFSELIISDKTKVENLNYINDIYSAGKHLLAVINDILDLSKASADKLKVDIVDLDLNKLITSSIRLIQPKADETKVELIEKLPKDHIIIKADLKRLKQVFLNLLSNSVKFTNPNGSVTVQVEKDELAGVVYIRVIDTGIGIEEKNIPKALSTFGQIDNSLGKKYEGTGLGLPLTRKLIELMHGKFDLQSKIGIGTTVTLTFTYDSSIEV